GSQLRTPRSAPSPAPSP
uniref:Predicted gene, 21954 n=1 Tax=Mus spicilegus TaxID=10103 RepID=A0A8C6N044_MUSSI